MTSDSEYGEAEENYFVSLSDMMTGVVFIFVILLTAYAWNNQTAARDAAEQRDAAANARAEAADAASAAKAAQISAKAAQTSAEAEHLDNQKKAEQIDALAKLLRDREQARREMLRNLRKRLEDQGVLVDLDEDNGIVRLPESLLFDLGQAQLSKDGERALGILGREVVAAVRDWCSPSSEYRLEALFVEGHTDNVDIHNQQFHDNWELSVARAVNTSRAMIEAAPEIETFRNTKNASILGVSGYADKRPVALNETREGRRRNRRIDLRFIVAYPTEEQFRRVRELLDPKDAR